MAPATHWSKRFAVLVGRGATGLLPILVFGFLSHEAGLEVLGSFASVFLTAQAIAEISDISSQRHVARLAAATETMDRLAAFQAIRIRVLVLAGGAVIAAILLGLGTGTVTFDLAVVALAGWTFGTNTFYAQALARNQYGYLAIGPLLGLLTTGVVLAALWTTRAAPPGWSVVAALHSGKLIELLLLRSNLSGLSASESRSAIRREWREVRFLFLQGLLSAGNARLIVPLVGVTIGTAAAGLLSLGMSVLSIVSLLSVALVLPAYRDVLDRPTPGSLLQALRYAKQDWWTAARLGVALAAVLAAGAGWLLAPLLGVANIADRLALAFVVLGGAFEPVSLFAGALYQACHRDRSLFQRSVATMAMNWAAVVVGAQFGSIGMSFALLGSRGAGALLLYWPALVERGEARKAFLDATERWEKK